MWTDVNATSFHRIKQLVTGQHVTVGSMLCGLSVKMAAWEERFGDGRGGPMARAEFVMSEFRQGIDKLKDIVKSAADLDAMS